MSDAARNPRRIYLNETTEGLQYEVVGLDGKLKKNTILWKELPPINMLEFIEAQDEFLPFILHETSKAGHTPETTHQIMEIIDQLGPDCWVALMLARGHVDTLKE